MRALMNLKFIENLTTYDSTTLLVAGIGLILVSLSGVIYIKVTADPNLIKNLLALKYKQKSLVGLVRNNLERIDAEIYKLNLDIETLEMFNTEHTKRLMEQTRYAEIAAQFIYLLNNEEISKILKDFLENTKVTAMQIFELEETLYKKQFEYNANVISNNNMLLNASHIDYDDVQDYKKVLLKKKEELTALINETQKNRKILRTQLLGLVQHNRAVQNKLSVFEKSKLDSKKFYFRYLSFI